MGGDRAIKKRSGEGIRLPAKASFYYIASTVIGKGASVLLTPIFTRAMSAGEFGAYSYYISVLSVVILLSGVFLSPTVIYSGLGKFKDEKSGFENSSIMLTAVITTAICLVLFTFNGVFGVDRRLVAFIYLQILFDSVVTAELLSGKFSYDYTKVVTINLVSAFLSPIISLFLIFRYGMGAEGRILGLLLTSGALALGLLFLRFGSIKIPKRSHTAYLLRNSVPLFPGMLARASMGWSDKLIINGRLGATALAKYSVAHTVGMALFGIIGALSSAINPWMVRKLSAREEERIFPVIKNLSEAISFASVFIMGLAPEIFAFLAPESYRDYTLAILPFALSTAPYFLFGAASVFITFSEKTRFISFASLLGAALNLGLNFLLISAVGPIGGAISYLISELAVFLSALWLLRGCDRRAYDMLKSPMPILFPLGFSMLFPMLYSFLSLRLLLLIFPGVMLVNRGFRCLMLVKEKGSEGA
ncbi:MAG: oligosaccharide flippase family protein [Clostridia bacterium]|nr:oligosaccharide flippase family protein [Clostridia bacterium]